MPLHPLSLVIPSCAPVGLGVPLSIRTTALPELTETQQDVSIQLVGRGGKAPRTWGLDGTSDPLPDTLSLDANTGVISGNVDAAMAASYDLVVELTDSDDPAVVVTKALTLVVNAAPSITTASLDGGTENTAYSDTLAATGGTGTLVWTVDAGTTDELPAGLSLSSAGVISGTPSEGTAATYAVTFRVTDANGVYATAELELVVADDLPPAPEITTTSPLAACTYFEAITPIQLAYTGGGTPLWEVTAGALIRGLVLDEDTGEITGTPTEIVTSKSVTIRVTTAGGNDSVVFAQTSTAPADLPGLMAALRAETFDTGDGTWTSDVKTTARVWTAPTESDRPSKASDAIGYYLDFASDHLRGDAATKTMFNGLTNTTLIAVVEDLADEATYIVYATSTSGSNGISLSPGTTGAGVIRFWDRRATTTSAIASRAIAAGTVAVAGVSKRNTAPKVYLGSGSSDAASPAADSDFNDDTPHHWIGAADTGGAVAGLFFTGKIRGLFYFNQELDATAMQTAVEFLEANIFPGATLWA